MSVLSPRLPRLLLTNDDGFDARGLQILAEVAREFADEIWIIAPEHDQSGTGQSVSIHQPLRCWPRGERQWAVSGTPADCVGLALAHLMGSKKPSFILSGINAGSNVGDEVSLSGTLGAAFMGLMMGTPSIAFSQDCVTRSATRWDTARLMTQRMLRYLLAQDWPDATCLSVNIPDCQSEEVKGFSWARQCHKNVAGVHVEKREDKRQQNYYWLSFVDKAPVTVDNSDYAILQRHEISVASLGLDRSLDVDLPSVRFDETSA